MLIIGHRGAMNRAPENTLKSIRYALQSNVDMVEIDIAVCRSGEAVVMHDDTVDRCTDGTGFISEMTLEQLKELDAGEGESIPTLQEVIDYIDGKRPLNIEIKGRGSAKEVARILKVEINEKGRSEDDFCVSSFDHRELAEFSRLYGEIRISPIVCCLPQSLEGLIGSLDIWSLNMKREFVSREIVEEAHSRGIKVLVFTVNTPGDLEKMRQIGVDGVFTNDKEQFSTENRSSVHRAKH